MAILAQNGQKIFNLFDTYTGVPFNATKVTLYADGTTMNDSKVDNAIYFKVPTNLGGGYAVRDYEGAIYASWFGLIADFNTGTGTGTDNTAKILKLMDVARKVRVKKIIFPTGRYGMMYLPLFPVTIEGVGSVTFHAMALSGSPTDRSFMRIAEDGPIDGYSIKNIKLRGHASNANQNGFNAVARPQTSPGYTGGYWHSVFEDMDIQDFTGHQINFECLDPVVSGTTYDMANQFLIFNNVRAYRSSDTTRAFRSNGQFGQVVFNTCQFDGSSLVENSINVELITSLASSNNTDQAYSVTFINTTFQGGDKGLRTYYGKNIYLLNCHWEKMMRPVFAETNSVISIRGGNFGLSGQKSLIPTFSEDTATSKVACLAFSGSGCQVSIDDCHSVTAPDFVASCTSGGGYIDYGKNNTIQNPRFNNTTFQTSVNSSGELTIDAARGRTILNSNAYALATINSTGGIGEQIVLQPLGNLIINETGNIRGRNAEVTSYFFKANTLIHLRFDGGSWNILNPALSYILIGSSAPEGVVAGPKGALYCRTSGTTLMFFKSTEDSSANNTGWKALGIRDDIDAAMLNKVNKFPTTQQANVGTDGTLNTGANSDYILNASTALSVRELATITSTLTGGDIIRFTCWPGTAINANPYVALNATGNIDLAGFGHNGKIILRDREQVTLMRSTTGRTWVVTAVKQIIKQAALPVAGYYFAGERIEKLSSTINDIFRWKVTTAGYAGENYLTSGSYTVGRMVIISGNVYECKTAGTAANNPPSGTGTGDQTDGTVVWVYVGPAAVFSPEGGRLAGWSKLVTAATTLTYADYGANGTLLVELDASAGSFDVTLPAASATRGFTTFFKRIDSSGNLPTIKGNGSELIDSANTYTGLTAQWSAVSIGSNGTKNYTL